MICLKNVTKIYDSGDTAVRALDGVNLHIGKGEMVAIMGASGSGKSTLLNIIGCLDEKTRGSYLINGRSVDGLGADELAQLRNAMFGYVLQDFAIIEDWTVYQNVRLPIDYRRKGRKATDEDIDALLGNLGIYEKKHVLARKLSGGQRQRVSIARALINNPEIILADEPTGALDRATGHEVLDIMRRIHETCKTIVIVTHDAEIAAMCDRVVRISDGQLD